MKANEIDVVELLEDLPEFGLKKGTEAVVLCAFSIPSEAYDLEVVTEGGNDSVFAYGVKPEQFEVVQRFEVTKE